MDLIVWIKLRNAALYLLALPFVAPPLIILVIASMITFPLGVLFLVYEVAYVYVEMLVAIIREAFFDSVKTPRLDHVTPDNFVPLNYKEILSESRADFVSASQRYRDAMGEVVGTGANDEAHGIQGNLEYALKDTQTENLQKRRKSEIALKRSTFRRSRRRQSDGYSASRKTFIH